MRIYIGSYSEDDADKVARDLRAAGVNCEIRPALDADYHAYPFVEGKLNELKTRYADGVIVDLLEEAEDNFDVARALLKDGMWTKDFEKKFLDIQFPGRKRFHRINRAIQEMSTEYFTGEKLEKHVSEIASDKELKEFFSHVASEMSFMMYFHEILGKNGVRYEDDKMYGSIPEDPQVKIYLAEDTIDAVEEEDLKEEFEVFVDKNVDVYANLVDVIYEFERVGKLCKEKPEYSELLIMLDLIDHIAKRITGKRDIDELTAEIAELSEENRQIHLSPSAIKELLKTMEKAEIIKIKKGKASLRK